MGSIESAKYSKQEAKEKFYEDHKYETKYAKASFADIVANDYFY